MPVPADQREELQRKLEELREDGEYIFPGTVACYLIWSKTYPGNSEILLVWRSIVMPNEATLAQELSDFRQALADVIDWSSARYEEGEVLLHT